MKAVDDKHTNLVYAKDQPEYTPLPAHRTPAGIVITAWELTDAEIDELLISKRIYLNQHTFNAALQPILLTTENPLENPEKYQGLQGYISDEIKNAYLYCNINYYVIENAVDIDGWIDKEMLESIPNLHEFDEREGIITTVRPKRLQNYSGIHE